jgi:acetyltransferase-like isoleucine patch superfamily enzyme/glycosyltransferase involved in cell wall biosynthesis
MIDVMIITHNEAINLPPCLQALQGWTNKVFVIDSGSTDGTQDLARSFGAEVVHHDWPGYAEQKNWGMENLPFESPWLLIVDADEVITPKLRNLLVELAGKPVDSVPENGFFINRLTYFLDRPIRHCGYYPSWNMRFFKRDKGRYENRLVHEHIIIDDPIGKIREPMLHEDRRGLEHYFAKHNRYSTLEARQLFLDITQPESQGKSANVTAETRRRRWLKRNVTQFVPLPSLWRFLYMYVIKLGVLDGAAGFEFCRFIATYDSMVALKLREMLRQRKRADRHATEMPAAVKSALSVPEGSVVTSGQRAATVPRPQVGVMQMQPEASPWSFKEKLGRAVWMIVGKPIFRISFHNWYGFRARLLRLFGARIGTGVAIRPSVNIEVPWMVEIEDDATIGDYAIIYSLGMVTIGKRSIISQYSHLCAGTHDYADHAFKLLRAPVTVGSDVWIGTDAFIGPGVSIGDLSVVGARSSVYKSLPPKMVCVGNPAKPIKERNLK